MQYSLLKLFDVFGIKSTRTKNIIKHIGWSVFYKFGGVAANFLVVPLTINYLDSENYGIWLTLSSFIGWFSLFDIGLGNGLRNKFAEAKANGNIVDAQAFVSTAYFTIGGISLTMLIIFLGLNSFINWAQLFNTNNNLQEQLSTLLPIVFTFFALQLVFKLITSIYQANQNHSIQLKIQFFVQSLSLLAIYILTKIDQSSLLLFGSIFSALPVLILIAINFYAFKTTLKVFKPKYSLFKKEHLKEITGLGFKFFVLQIAALVLFSTDNFIISRIFSPAQVVPYNIAFKYFSIVTMGYSIIITPYWSSITEAFSVNDFQWIKKSINNIQKIWLLIPFALLLMLFLSEWVYYLWIGDKIYVPLSLSLSMAFYVLLITFNMVYVNFINGVGKIKLQLITAIVSIVINIPLSIFFAKYLEWGINGVIIATCCSLGYSVILRPLQYHKIINNKAKGIWDK